MQGKCIYAGAYHSYYGYIRIFRRLSSDRGRESVSADSVRSDPDVRGIHDDLYKADDSRGYPICYHWFYDRRDSSVPRGTCAYAGTFRKDGTEPVV